MVVEKSIYRCKKSFVAEEMFQIQCWNMQPGKTSEQTTARAARAARAARKETGRTATAGSSKSRRTTAMLNENKCKNGSNAIMALLLWSQRRAPAATFLNVNMPLMSVMVVPAANCGGS